MPLAPVAEKKQHLWLPWWISERNASEKYYRDGGAIVKEEMRLKKDGTGHVAITRIYQG